MSFLNSVLGTLSVLAGLSYAHAATLDGTQRHATGINNLIVDGVSYNVTFSTAPLDDVYPSPTQVFFSSSMSYDAVSSVANFFNSNGVTGIINDPTYEFNVPYARNNDDSFDVYESFNGGHQVGGWQKPSSGRPGGNTNYDHNSVAIFSVASVPLPPAAPMFGAALLGLAALGYGVKRRSRPKEA